ncbi:MAG: sensor domain-containing protein [Anaerolineae bacterium]|nr:sensor domain-containing protein [Anaerolineae bacterium]MCI0607463.1 sensor domain-containing protein [Anaerolineae bacterium]
MIKSVEEYLDLLKSELQGSDAATIQDALADAEEHLRAALTNLREAQPEMSEEEALNQVIEQYGSPSETASAYMEVERRTIPQLTRESPKTESALMSFFGVYADARAWGSLLYMLIAFVTGIFYFTWAVTGLSISLSFSIFIFGLPLALLFLLSVRGLALLEGRLVEALLGVRMPRRPLFTQQNLKWIDRLKELVTDRHTWFSTLYMFIQFVLGTVYFVVVVTVFSVSVSLVASPFLQEIMKQSPIMDMDLCCMVLAPTWTYPLLILGGVLLWTTFMNLVRGVGQLHGRMAKAMLVTD